jgi:tryptophan-rich sensory protein
MQSRGSRLLPLAFLALVVGGGWAIGFFNRPGPWYAQLAKPGFTPPGWLFAPVWTVLYVFIALAGWRTAWERPRSLAIVLWWLQLALNFVWTPIFFSAHQIGVALAIVTVLAMVNLAFIAISWRADWVSALLFVPYAAWIAFATALNGGIFVLN